MAIITFRDADGREQTLDTGQKFNVAYHADCRDILRAMPDKCVDLICADPPYGDGRPRGDSSQIVNVERERGYAETVEPIRTALRPIQGSGSSDSTEAERRTRGRSTYSRTAQYPPPNFQNLPNQLNEPEEPGRKSTGKKS